MPKAKLSVTVDAELLKKVDRVAGGSSRSEIVEKALSRWLRSRKRQELDSEIERYYAEMSAGEREEDSAWAELGRTALSDTWS